MKSDAGTSRREAGSRVKQQNISLFPIEYRALRLLAEEERNENISAAVARMIDTAMTDRYGNNWRNQAPLDQESSDATLAVA